MAGSEIPEFAGSSQTAGFLLLSVERLRQLSEEGIVPKAGRGKYPLRETVAAYIQFLRKSALAARSDGKTERVKDARAREIELRIAEKEKRLISVDAHIAHLDTIVGKLKSEITGLPAAFTRDRESRFRLEDLLNGALKRAADKLDARADELEARRPSVSAGGKANARRVGKGKSRLPANKRLARAKKTGPDAVHDPGSEDDSGGEV